jgi:hypothetical protein
MDMFYSLICQDITTLAAAREYSWFGPNTTVSSNQAIRIYAAASVAMSQMRG